MDISQPLLAVTSVRIDGFDVLFCERPQLQFEHQTEDIIDDSYVCLMETYVFMEFLEKGL